MPLAGEEKPTLKRVYYGFMVLLSLAALLLLSRGFIHFITKRDMTLQRIHCKHNAQIYLFILIKSIIIQHPGPLKMIHV